MPQYELLLPKMGESVAEATIIKWLKAPGDLLEEDDTIVEIATDKVDSEVTSPVKGKLAKLLFKADDVVQVGAVLALIETDPEGKPQPALPTEKTEYTVKTENVPVKEALAQPVFNEAIPGLSALKEQENPQQAEKTSARFYSPLVRSIAAQENISQQELDQIPGHGAEGRLTKDDLLEYLQNKQSAPSTDISEKEETPKQPLNNVDAKAEKADDRNAAIYSSSGDEIVEMDRMRKMIADHMVISKQTSPHVTSFIETDVTDLVLWREKIKTEFASREGEKITFTPIFVEAVAKALKDMPMVNVSVKGTQIIRKKNINIGMATALDNGNLIVPVIRNADSLNILGLTKAVNDLALRARANKLKPDEVQDGTFTITNIGSFGNIMGTPIINQPQAAILAIGVIKKKPAVIETSSGDMIAIRHLLYLSLSYDHRIIDGALGGMFLKKVSDYLENWDSKRSI